MDTPDFFVVVGARLEGLRELTVDPEPVHRMTTCAGRRRFNPARRGHL